MGYSLIEVCNKSNGILNNNNGNERYDKRNNVLMKKDFDNNAL